MIGDPKNLKLECVILSQSTSPALVSRVAYCRVVTLGLSKAGFHENYV